jgi:type II secretion system protein G
MKTRKYKHGLSLVETLIVIAVIALLTTMVISVASRIDNQSKEQSVESTFAVLEGALQEYKEFYGDFPISISELYSVPECRKILEKIGYSQGMISDPWGMQLQYRYAPGDNFPELISAGPDRKFGTADDITNRKK